MGSERDNEMSEDELRDPTGRLSRVDATARFRQELDNALGERYPAITQQNLDTFREGRIDFGVLDVRTQDESLRRNVLATALERASNPDDIAFNQHGAEHTVYQETLDVLATSVRDGNYSLTVSPSTRRITTDRGVEMVTVERYRLTSPQYIRTTFRPQAIEDAEALPKGNVPDKLVFTEIRRLALDQGVSYATIVATYRGYSPDKIFEIFSERNFQREMTEKHGKVKFPTPNRPTDRRMLMQLADNIVVKTSSGTYPNRSRQAHMNGVETLVNFGWINPNEPDQLAYQMTPVEDFARAVAVFTGMTEVAHENANKRHLDPDRSEYIDDRYGRKMTTRIITAFQEIEPIPKDL